MSDKRLSYSEAIEEIELILKQIESNTLDVDILSDRVRRVTLLIEQCKDKLTKTEVDIDKIFEKDREL